MLPALRGGAVLESTVRHSGTGAQVRTAPISGTKALRRRDVQTAVPSRVPE
ncbi:hypothetical protein [Amycolatopsis japonica]|uniref:hypothetical protein n=1 Tax=Amycolatopsis japonica TaxID=208439 RepID=UPI00331913BD